jgi:hypothetical protein
VSLEVLLPPLLDGPQFHFQECRDARGPIIRFTMPFPVSLMDYPVLGVQICCHLGSCTFGDAGPVLNMLQYAFESNIMRLNIFIVEGFFF